MTYTKAWELTRRSNYSQAESEGWGEDWLIADEHVRLTDYDYSAGIINNLSDYDD